MCGGAIGWKGVRSMHWIHAFEIICYLLTAVLMADIVAKKHWNELQVFFSGALAGFVLELGAVRFTEIYHYSQAFYVSIGTVPNQFPFFGGLMWGGVGVCALRIARKFHTKPLKTALLAGWLVVSMDLLLDVAAIRLDGGFWVWEGRPITLAIDHHMWMSVIWVNFLGYLFETPALVYFSLQNEKRPRGSFAREALRTIGITCAAVAVVAAGSAVFLYLDGVTDEWASFVGFIALWSGILGSLVRQLVRARGTLSLGGQKDPVLLVFWSALYGYCLIALSSLGVFRARPGYALFAIILFAFTLFLGAVREGTEGR